MNYCASCGATRQSGADFCGACGTAHATPAPAMRAQQQNVERITPRLRAKVERRLAARLLPEEVVLGSFRANRWGMIRQSLIITADRLLAWEPAKGRVVTIPLRSITAVEGKPFLGTAVLHVSAASMQHRWEGMNRDDVLFCEHIIAGTQAGRHYVST